MKRILLGCVFIAVMVCFAQDVQVSWDGFYVNYFYKSEGKDPKTITALDFDEHYIIDKIADNKYFVLSRTNGLFGNGIRDGGGSWGIMEIRGDELYENIHSRGFRYAYTITKPGQEFVFSDCSGPGEAYFVYSKLQFYPQEE